MSREVFRAARLALILSLLLALAGLGAQPASAQQEARLGMADTGYYTQTSDPVRVIGGLIGSVLCTEVEPLLPPHESRPGVCLDPSTLVTSTPGWPRLDNYIYVARILADVRGNDSYGYGEVDLLTIPFGATVRSLVLQFQIEANPDAGTLALDFDSEQPNLRLCLVTAEWTGVDGGPWDARPNHDCGIQAAPEFVGEETRVEPDPLSGEERDRTVVTYRADLTAMAAAWANGSNNGFAWVPTANAPDNWQVAIRPAHIADDALFATVAFDPPPPAAPVAPPPPTTFDDPPLTFEEFVEGEFFVPETPQFTVEAPGVEMPEIGRGTRAALPPSDPRTPWWVWTVFPLGLATLATLGRGLSAEPPLAAERSGPVSKLMQRRSMRGA